MASICFLCNTLVSRCVGLGFRIQIEIGQTRIICDSLTFSPMQQTNFYKCSCHLHFSSKPDTITFYKLFTFVTDLKFNTTVSRNQTARTSLSPSTSANTNYTRIYVNMISKVLSTSCSAN